MPKAKFWDGSKWINLDAETAIDTQKLGGELPSFYATAKGLSDEITRATNAELTLNTNITMQNKEIVTSINEVSGKLNNHIDDKISHITSIERTTWNNKQNILSGNVIEHYHNSDRDYNNLYNKPDLSSMIGKSTFVFDQLSPKAIWNVTHNLAKYPSITVTDSAGSVVVGDINYISSNQLTITFSSAFSGKAYLN